MDKRHQDKIRKLLALSQSDNPHEAETARRQAMALMKKHQINEDELAITEVLVRPIARKNIKEYESNLLTAIMAISGTYCVINFDCKLKRDRYQWFCIPTFIGLETDTQLAAYSFDVLHQQLEKARADFKKKFRANAKQQDQFCVGWVLSAGRKLVNVFGQKQAPKEVDNHHAKHTKGMTDAKARKTKIDNKKEADACKRLGWAIGDEALLNQATTNQQEQQLRLGGIA